MSAVAAAVVEDYPNADHDEISNFLGFMICRYPRQFTAPTDAGVTEALVCVADSACRDFRTDDLHHSPQYDYRVSDVRLLLETVYADQTYWLDGYVPEDAASLKASADSLDLHCDVSWGISQLHRNDQRLLLLYYCDGFELDPELEPQFHSAVCRLTEQLNSYRGNRCI